MNNIKYVEDLMSIDVNQSKKVDPKDVAQILAILERKFPGVKEPPHPIPVRSSFNFNHNRNLTPNPPVPVLSTQTTAQVSTPSASQLSTPSPIPEPPPISAPTHNL